MRLAFALLACFLGLACLALSMTRHWRQVFPDSEPPVAAQATLRVAGACGLAASLILCLSNDYWTMASLVWVMMLAFCAVIVAMVLAWRPR
jgi:hypothetical protein